jgi:hypothetical protein
MENRKDKQVLFVGLYQWEGERVLEDEYAGNIMYSYIKKEK